MKTASLAPAFVFVLAGSTVWAQEPDAANPPPPPDSPPPVVAEPSGKDPLVGEIPLENEAMNRAFVGEDEGHADRRPGPGLALAEGQHRSRPPLGARGLCPRDLRRAGRLHGERGPGDALATLATPRRGRSADPGLTCLRRAFAYVLDGMAAPDEVAAAND